MLFTTYKWNGEGGINLRNHGETSITITRDMGSMVCRRLAGFSDLDHKSQQESKPQLQHQKCAPCVDDS